MHEVPVRMPKMSMTMTEGEVISWAVAPGAQVNSGDTVCEVLTDKVDMEVESPVSGRLVRIDVESGVAQVGDPIAWIETEDDDALAGLFDAPDAPPAPSAVPDAEPEPDIRPTSTGPVAAVPRARALAREYGIDLADVVGTGPDGRVLVADVQPATAVAPATPPAAAPAPVRAAPPAGPLAPSKRARAVRAAVARTMTASAAVPQFTLWRDLDVEAADAGRGRVSWTTVLLRAYSAALREVPALLGRWDGARVVPADQVDVAMAVDTPDGLLVPAFSDADLMGIEALDLDVRATVASARAGRIDAAHLLPAVASLSNLGVLGVDRFQALVTPPQASVLACGTIDRQPMAVPGGFGLRLRVSAGLTVDHRVADGADGARLLAALAAVLDDPMRLLGPVTR